MHNLAKHRMDPAKEQNGFEFTYDEEEGVVFTLARAGGSNKEFDKALEEAMKPYRRNGQLGIKIPEEKDALILKEVFAETVLKAWRGIKNEDGSDFQFTKENAVRLFTEFPDIFMALRVQANELSNFRKEALEVEAKN